MNRRQYLGAAAAVALSRADAQPASEWGGPVLDIHLHPRRQDDHSNGSGVTKAVLLT